MKYKSFAKYKKGPLSDSKKRNLNNNNNISVIF